MGCDQVQAEYNSGKPDGVKIFREYDADASGEIDLSEFRYIYIECVLSIECVFYIYTIKTHTKTHTQTHTHTHTFSMMIQSGSKGDAEVLLQT